MLILPKYVSTKPAGYIVYADKAGYVEAEGDMLQCVHCQYMWRVQPGSGVQRGWCSRCKGPTCGIKQVCETSCRPYMKMIEQIEAQGNKARFVNAVSKQLHR